MPMYAESQIKKNRAIGRRHCENSRFGPYALSEGGGLFFGGALFISFSNKQIELYFKNIQKYKFGKKQIFYVSGRMQ